MDDLVDYLAEKLKAAQANRCTCPRVEITTLTDHCEGLGPQFTRGYDHGCPEHGPDGGE